ncbi:hypothetical protein CYMTET_41100 [Cymbomonas tetramitiformis]|uniref:Uncharacterized protein n=1 Tax=Cymbomonas tetramitiformis TaxID=36881 RepID=A0AAE0C836_9CHLO|nr:hypothetical protein CYMTET_41100 [Cymbomonas tetramitiformis]
MVCFCGHGAIAAPPQCPGAPQRLLLGAAQCCSGRNDAAQCCSVRNDAAQCCSGRNDADQCCSGRNDAAQCCSGRNDAARACARPRASNLGSGVNTLRRSSAELTGGQNERKEQIYKK